MATLDRIQYRSRDKNESAKPYISIYEIIENISNEVVNKQHDLIQQITLKKVPESALETIIIKIINTYNYLLEGRSRDSLVKEILDYIFRYGILQKFLDISDCNGVFVNGPDNVWAKVGNRIQKTDISFGNINSLQAYIQSIKSKFKGELNENSPMNVFKDESQKLRIFCGIQPIAHKSPFLVFRKHSEIPFSIEDLVGLNMLNGEMADELVRCTKAGANIIICGRGGAGKTTLMRALLETIDEEERILAMEEIPELYLSHPNAVQIQTKRTGDKYDLTKVSEMGLIMSIDRYVYGEIRSSEAMSFFHGAFSGNSTMTNIHAKSAKEAIKKAMVMMMMSGTSLSEEMLLEMLHSCTNIIVFLDSFKVKEVLEIVYEDEFKEYNQLWNFKTEKRTATEIEGAFIKYGNLKSTDMLEKLRHKGFDCDV